MAHPNRGRLLVNLRGDWRAYCNAVPDGATAIGTLTRGGETGALIRLSDGTYSMGVGELLYSIDGRKVAAALGHSGRPVEIQSGRRVNIYLDADSVRAAKKIGDGNLSLGIRLALRRAQK